MRVPPMRAQFMLPSLPRNPLLRGLAVVGAIAVVGAVLTVGFVIGAAVLVVATAALTIQRWRLGRAARKAQSGIIEGEFTVVPDGTPAKLPRLD